MLILIAIWIVLSSARRLDWLLLFVACLFAFLSSSVIGLIVALGLALLVWRRTAPRLDVRG